MKFLGEHEYQCPRCMEVALLIMKSGEENGRASSQGKRPF